MKGEYKQKALEHLNAIEKRTQTLSNMLEGKEPADQKRAITISKEILRLVELNKNIVDIS
jgi:hypothetical protein